MCPDVEKHITRSCGGGVLRALEHRERMQPCRGRSRSEAGPEIGPEPDDAAQFALRHPETDGSPEPAQISQQFADLLLAARIHRQHQKDRCLGDRSQDRLGLNSVHIASQLRWPAKPTERRLAGHAGVSRRR